MSRIDDFLAIEDKDLKSYIYTRKGGVYDQQISYKLNTEEKLGYYTKTEKVARNRVGAFYKMPKLDEWIVYNKATKKVKVSNNLNNLKRYFIDDYIRSDVQDIVRRFVGKLTPTLCKKMIEGKIQTLGDLISYHKSYTIRKKSISLETTLKFMVYNKDQWLHVLEDPENIQTVKQLSDITSNANIATSMPFKVKVEDAHKMEDMYEKWIKEQDTKYVAFQRPRNADVGNSNVLVVAGQGTTIDY